MLVRMQSLLWENFFPHVNQSAYRKKVSGADAIFATQEVSRGEVGLSCACMILRRLLTQ